MSKVGEITLYWGGMFTGKTSGLIENMIEAGEGGIAFKPIVDDRYSGDEIIDHDGNSVPATPIKQASEIFICLDSTIKTVCIDEVSLMEDDITLIPTIIVLRDMGINVVLTGLDRTHKDTAFTQTAVIASLADNVIKLRTPCYRCVELASVPFLKEKSDEIVVVGGANKYEQLCRTCYNKAKASM